MAIELIREFSPADRYLYDFNVLTYAKGWAQVDTKQDASYYGTWTNPDKLQIFNYCEGDTCLTKCDTPEDYLQALAKMRDWNVTSGYWLGIDPGLDPAMREKFAAIGAADFLYE